MRTLFIIFLLFSTFQTSAQNIKGTYWGKDYPPEIRFKKKRVYYKNNGVLMDKGWYKYYPEDSLIVLYSKVRRKERESRKLFPDFYPPLVDSFYHSYGNDSVIFIQNYEGAHKIWVAEKYKPTHHVIQIIHENQ